MDTQKPILNWTDQAIAVWISQNIKLQKGVSIEEILNAERLLDFRFPQEFIDLYTKINGFKDLDWNEHMFSLWPLDRVLKEYMDGADKNYIGFCDYLISIHTIGFVKNKEGIFKNYDPAQSIGNTFKEGIEMINSNADNIY
jgi:cell wall assembly regulator SMI1